MAPQTDYHRNGRSLMLQDKRQTLRFPNQVSWKVGRWSNSIALWNSVAQEIFLHQNFQWQKPPSSSFPPSPNTYFHMNRVKRQVFSSKEISSEGEDVWFLPSDPHVHSSLLAKFPSCTTPSGTRAMLLSCCNASQDVLRCRTALGHDNTNPEKHFQVKTLQFFKKLKVFPS